MVLCNDAPGACHLIEPFALLNLQPAGHSSSVMLSGTVVYNRQCLQQALGCSSVSMQVHTAFWAKLHAPKRCIFLAQLQKAISRTSRCLRSRYRVMSICIVQRDMQADPTQRNMPARRPAKLSGLDVGEHKFAQHVSSGRQTCLGKGIGQREQYLPYLTGTGGQNGVRQAASIPTKPASQLGGPRPGICCACRSEDFSIYTYAHAMLEHDSCLVAHPLRWCSHQT